jgi:hypothetical protein
MNTNKILVGGIIGGIVSFLLGWLVWGMLLADFMTQHQTEAGKAVMRGEENMIWWAMIVANLFYGWLVSYVVGKAGSNSIGSGATTGAVTGLLFAVSIDCILYGTTDISDTTWLIVDVVANTVVTAIIGAVIGWYMGMGKKAA